ncbi:hypothetical protein GGR53DRAFT_271350 [Hypoxylon sp. FL1150]|nr:hypothetical protein GGR53DRAFT_271350 [Hypoxylon sp. FL1150]
MTTTTLSTTHSQAAHLTAMKVAMTMDSNAPAASISLSSPASASRSPPASPPRPILKRRSSSCQDPRDASPKSRCTESRSRSPSPTVSFSDVAVDLETGEQVPPSERSREQFVADAQSRKAAMLLEGFRQMELEMQEWRQKQKRDKKASTDGVDDDDDDDDDDDNDDLWEDESRWGCGTDDDDDDDDDSDSDEGSGDDDDKWDARIAKSYWMDGEEGAGASARNRYREGVETAVEVVEVEVEAAADDYVFSPIDDEFEIVFEAEGTSDDEGRDESLNDDEESEDEDDSSEDENEDEGGEDDEDMDLEGGCKLD